MQVRTLQAVQAQPVTFRGDTFNKPIKPTTTQVLTVVRFSKNTADAEEKSASPSKGLMGKLKSKLALLFAPILGLAAMLPIGCTPAEGPGPSQTKPPATRSVDVEQDSKSGIGIRGVHYISPGNGGLGIGFDGNLYIDTGSGIGIGL